MTKRDHQIIYDQLSAEMRERKERQRQAIERISTHTIADKVLGWLIITCLVSAIVLLVKYLNHA